MARMPDGWVITVESDRKALEVRISSSRELVMCKNCKHCYFASNRVPAEKAHVCSIFGYDVALDFYCKNGERRDGDG